MEEHNAVAAGWVYVFVCDPGKEESFLGLYDSVKDVNFVPIFRNKDEANDCFLNLPRQKGKKYELQAIHIEELQEAASENGFTVALVDSEGRLVQQ